MFDRRDLLAAFGACAAPLTFAIHAGAETAQPVGKVASVTGVANGRRGDANSVLKLGDDVFVGERLRTHEASRLRADLGAATRLFMGENTRVMIDRHLVRRGGAIHLAAGALLFDREAPDPKPPVVIRSPFALISVRGTTVFAGPSKGMFGVFVAKGEVIVHAGGDSVALRPGEGTNIVRPGARPTPVARWGAPRIDAALASVR